ncbi:hypothetical protein NONO_c44930 [Nocardia nova SH22a]|uniref:DUF3291 domain-containing protein n=1 Tax=Nocardia nova SH22a TaxID=1415166 RepID=W5TJ62_9NOCA|nr:DUF3291 domain-containing protein [Nocardia nova]AHH19277.1 hypothetical protein NONO_c44930 [Nocardia nova SH22a]
MPALPWVTIDRPATDTVQIMASRLEVRSLRHVPRFFATSMRLWRQARRSPGAVGVTLKADLAARTFWTLSAWSDADAITAYARTEPHASAIVSARAVMRESTFVFWSASTGELPIDWAEARRRIAEKRETPAGQPLP